MKEFEKLNRQLRALSLDTYIAGQLFDLLSYRINRFGEAVEKSGLTNHLARLGLAARIASALSSVKMVVAGWIHHKPGPTG